MTFLDELFEWSKTRPDWMRDAIRRLYEGDITEKDESEILNMLKKAKGLKVKSALQPEAFTLKSTLVTKHGDGLIKLSKLHSIKNVNKLKDGETLIFEPKGITVVYGDNASGKSGYGRVFKRACRSRYHEGQIQPNLFASAKSPSVVAEAVFELLQPDGKIKSVHWKDNRQIIDELMNIAIFDKECARVHVTDENEVYFLPYGADILINLARLNNRIKGSLESEIDN
jgi:hypothetical protein